MHRLLDQIQLGDNNEIVDKNGASTISPPSSANLKLVRSCDEDRKAAVDA